MSNPEHYTPMRLHSTKTSLYKLVGEYVTMPKIKDTDFIKIHRSYSYQLEWDLGTSRAFFTPCMGKIILVIDTSGSRKVYYLDSNDLIERGMLRAKG